MDRATYQAFTRLIYETSGITLGDNKKVLLESRIAKRLRELGLEDAKSYLVHLQEQGGRDELLHLLDAVSTNHTAFNREPKHFAILIDHMRRWVAAGQTRFRLWSAACSSGEEPYNMAMVILDAFGPRLDVKILATDISTTALTKAHEGVYPESRLEPLGRAMVLKYFERHGENRNGERLYKVKPQLADMVSVKRLNLASPPYPMSGPMDVVFCRNVMIYFDEAIKQGLVSEIERLLKPGGLLCIGYSETLMGLRYDLERLGDSAYLKPEARGS